MARIGLHVLLGTIALALAFSSALVAGGNESPDQRQKHILAVQVALDQGLDLIQKGDYSAAVVVLEKQLAHIDGNRRYLAALRDAYAGLVQQLEKAGRTNEARKYRGFLEILEPSGRTAATRSVDPVSPAARTTPAATKPADPVAAMPRTAPVHRGKIEDDDPFAEANGLENKSRVLLARAERAFEERGYETAARLYAQADRAEPGCAAACQERWAYCKLYAVAQSLNRGADSYSPAVLEQEIQQALRMAPRLDRFAQGLMSRLRGGGGSSTVLPTVEVRHTRANGNGWAVAETTNVRVFHQLAEDKAEKIARIAENTRITMTRRWFGEEAKSWSPRCDIYIHANGQAYSRATGAPAGSPGHSSISLENGRITIRRVDIRGDDANFLIGVLPHETTHVVLAGRFGHHHVPRWADEGMAVLSEPRDRVELHLRNLPTHLRDGTLFNLAELMRMADYPEPRRVGAFYAQSVSVVDFLCKKKDPATFARFLREALDGNYETALERHFGYRSFTELEADWKQHAFGAESVATVTEKR